MNDTVTWWQKPRRIAVVIDNGEWMLPYCESLVASLCAGGDEARLYRDYENIKKSAVSFFLSCHHIVPTEILSRSQRNLIVHASDLPRGRGMSPLTWQVLEEHKRIPLCLLEAADEVDSGAIIYRDVLDFAGHELIDEMRRAVAELSIALCQRYLAEVRPPEGKAQQGEATYWPRRGPEDSVIDAQASIADQFDKFRVVDNERYPAFFDWQGHRYRLRIDKLANDGDASEEE